MVIQEMIEPTTQTDRPVDERVEPGSLADLELRGLASESSVQSLTPTRGPKNPVCRVSSRSDPLRGQSSIPRVGEEGTAISRDGIRPAR